MRSKVLKPLDFSAFINGTDAMKTEQTTAERMCYIVNDKDLSQQAKDFLSQIHKTDALINRLANTVATLRSSLTSTGSQLKQDKVQTSGPKNTLEEGIARIDELERTINIRIDELIDLKQTAFNMIKRIPDLDQQNILIARYIQNMKWDSIADEMDHEIRWVYKTHGKALIAFANSNEQLLVVAEQPHDSL
jgi:hypothetical protein